MAQRDQFLSALASGARLLGIDVSDPIAASLAAHYTLLIKWAAKMNLTAITDPVEAAHLHALDSLLFAELIDRDDRSRTVDVGSGAGFPGIPLALVRPLLDMTLLEPIRRELLTVNRDVPVFRILTLSSYMSEAIADSRLTATLVATCGGMALLLASIGVYGVIAYAVARRTREIGVRLALGAQPWHIMRLVLREGLGIMSAGIAFGLAAAAVAARTLESVLYGVTPSDPATYLLVPMLLASVALLAACAPTRRALRVQPNAVLRQE